MGVPFYEIKDESFFSVSSSEFFNDVLYKKIMLKSGSSVNCHSTLKLDYYK